MQLRTHHDVRFDDRLPSGRLSAVGIRSDTASCHRGQGSSARRRRRSSRSHASRGQGMQDVDRPASPRTPSARGVGVPARRARDYTVRHGLVLVTCNRDDFREARVGAISLRNRHRDSSATASPRAGHAAAVPRAGDRGGHAGVVGGLSPVPRGRRAQQRPPGTAKTVHGEGPLVAAGWCQIGDLAPRSRRIIEWTLEVTRGGGHHRDRASTSFGGARRAGHG